MGGTQDRYLATSLLAGVLFLDLPGVELRLDIAPCAAEGSGSVRADPAPVQPASPAVGTAREKAVRIYRNEQGMWEAEYPLGIIMVYVPAGELLMGSPEGEIGRNEDEGPQHLVKISHGFWIGKYEATQSLMKALFGRTFAYYQGSDDCPLEWVSLDDIQELLKALNEKTGLAFRLPSEAEWEYACRAGTTSPFAFGDSLSSAQATFDGSSPYGSGAKGTSQTKPGPVGSFSPNAWGLHDMHGNVWEWCEDVYKADIYRHPELYTNNAAGNPVYAGEGNEHVLRGGGCLGKGATLRSAARGHQEWGFIYSGFRLCMDNR
ncbi:MAG: formylglycine-generating enzyme family protein [Acidobacteriota bacterium]